MKPMTYILNLILTFAIFGIGSHFFPESINITSFEILILATILMFIMNAIYSILVVLSFMLIPLGVGCITSPLLILISFILTPLKLWILDKYLTGFELNGIWTYIILTLLFMVFTFKTDSKTTSKEN